jgi:hypothetical protein
MMWFLLESALVNAGVLSIKTIEKAQLEQRYSHFEFRKMIALQLAAQWEDMGCYYANIPLSPTKPYQSAHAKAARNSFVVRPAEDKFSCPNKHVQYLEKMPLKEGSKRPNRQMLCKYCKAKRTIYW